MEVAYDGFSTVAVGGAINLPAIIILDQPVVITERQEYLQGSTTNVINLQGNAAGGYLTPGLPYQQG